MNITQLEGFSKIDPGDGCLQVFQKFQVQRNESSEPHIVTVEINGDDGAPIDEKCDCKGFQFKRKCSHIDAVYNASVLTVEWKN